MRAVVFDGTMRFRDDVPEPEPSPGEALIKVRLAGICNTDIEISQGYMNFRGIIGHEFVGEVVASPVAGWVGKRVAGEINACIPNCPGCRDLTRQHCPNRSVLGILARDGTYAEYIRLPVENLHSIPDNVTDEAAVFVEPLAAAFQVLKQVHVGPESHVLVLGDGKLGQLVARVVQRTGATLVCASRSASEKQIKLAEAGITTALNTELVAAHYNVVVDCTGSAEGFEQAVDHTRPAGTLVLKSTVAHGVKINLAPVVVNEITVVGSRCGPFDQAIAALADGSIDVSPLLDTIYPLSEIETAFEHAQRPGVLKVALRP